MNASGIHPTGHQVLIKLEKAAEKIGSILLPGSAIDRDNTASQKGAVVETGPTAGDYTDWPEGYSFPKAGDRVLIRKFAGVEVSGSDGEEYRVCEDKDILAVLEG